MANQDFITSGQISAALIDEGLEAGLSRVCWILRTRRRVIRPVARAGPAFIFKRSAIRQVRDEIRAIDARRSGREGVACAVPP